jgi:hypothetical protein
VVIELFTGEDKPIKVSADMNFSEFSYTWTCFIIFGILFLITMKRDLTIFIKINTFGVIFTMIIIAFIISVGLTGLYHGGYEYSQFTDNIADEDLDNDRIILFASAYSHLMGTLGGGFYLHNISLPIYQNSKQPEKAVRDMFFGFLVVCLSYITCGVLGMYGFKSPYLFPDEGGEIG